MYILLVGYGDHTAMIAGDEIHNHYNGLFKTGDTLFHGRTAYHPIKGYWLIVVKNPRAKMYKAKE